MMNNQRHIELISAYIDGSITADERAELNRLIDEGTVDMRQIKQMEATYRLMGNIQSPLPSDRMRGNFYDMLEKEKQQNMSIQQESLTWINQMRNRLTLPQVAFAAFIFLAGLFIGNLVTPFQNYREEISTLSNEVTQMREVVMMSLLDDNSATERLKAVNISSEIPTADRRIARALLQTLNNDPNVNVRLAAVEALVQHASAPQVREGLVASINGQDSPLVQAALADAMLVLQEKRAVQQFRELLKQDSIEPGVRDKLQTTIAALS